MNQNTRQQQKILKEMNAFYIKYVNAIEAQTNKECLWVCGENTSINSQNDVRINDNLQNCSQNAENIFSFLNYFIFPFFFFIFSFVVFHFCVIYSLHIVSSTELLMMFDLAFVQRKCDLFTIYYCYYLNAHHRHL